MRRRELRRALPPLLWGVALLACIVASLVAASGPEGLFGAFLAACMIGIAAIDARRFIIPNELVIAGLLLALLRAALVGFDPGLHAVAWAMLGAVLAALPLLTLMFAYRWWRGRDGLGLGDVKLAAVAGAWLGLQTIFVVIELAALAAIAAYLLGALLRRRALRGSAFLPFGAFLAPAIWIGWLVEKLSGT